MKFKFFTQEHSNVKAENRLFRFIGAFIGIGFLVNAGVTIYALGHQTTILVPPVINTKLEMVGNSAPDEYIRVFGRYTAWLALNYSPATARSQFSELLALYAPEKYAESRKAFYIMADAIETGQVSSAYHIVRIRIDRTRNMMEITGTRKQYANDQLMENRDKAYVIEYQVADGRFQIKRFYETVTTK